MAFITRVVSFLCRFCYKNMLNYDNDNKCRLSLIVEQMTLLMMPGTYYFSQNISFNLTNLGNFKNIIKMLIKFDTEPSPSE